VDDGGGTIDTAAMARFWPARPRDDEEVAADETEDSELVCAAFDEEEEEERLLLRGLLALLLECFLDVRLLPLLSTKSTGLDRCAALAFFEETAALVDCGSPPQEAMVEVDVEACFFRSRFRCCFGARFLLEEEAGTAAEKNCELRWVSANSRRSRESMRKKQVLFCNISGWSRAWESMNSSVLRRSLRSVSGSTASLSV